MMLMIKKDAEMLCQIDEIDFKRAFSSCMKDGMIYIITNQGFYL